MLLSVQDLSVYADDVPIVQEVSLSVSQGEIVALIGESGSGKSTVLLSIMGVLGQRYRQTGQVLFDGVDLSRCSETDLCQVRGREMAMVFQDPRAALDPLMKVGIQVEETLRLHGYGSSSAIASRMSEISEHVGLSPAQCSRYPHQLSGGQCQRICIASAFAANPRLVLADEPLTALDPLNHAQMCQFFQSFLKEQNASLLLVTHDLKAVLPIANRFYLMCRGRILEHCTRSEIVDGTAPAQMRMLLEATCRTSIRAVDRSEEAKKREGDTQAPVLEVRDLVCAPESPEGLGFLGTRQSISSEDQINFTLHRGEIVALVGESGAGKSTLARTILGIQPPVQGCILLEGAVVSGFSGKVQAVFQNPYDSFNPWYKVGHLVAEPLYLLGGKAPRGAERKETVDWILETVGLSAADSEKSIDQFSGGQLQRISLARALISSPSLLILDEAFSALDARSRGELLDLLLSLVEKFSLSVLCISHDFQFVKAIADSILIMQEGRIVEQGKMSAVLADPIAPYTRALISAERDLHSALPDFLR